MKLAIQNGLGAAPYEVRILESTEAEHASLKSLLTFRDRQVEFLIARHKRNWRFKESGPVKWQLEMDRLKEQVHRCILFTHDGGAGIGVDNFSTYAGLVDDIIQAIPGTTCENQVLYPTFNSVPWDKVPQHENRYYQDEAKKALIEARHAAVQLPTGSGKSTVIRDIVHDIGLQAMVMAPTTSIARQLYVDFCKHFGKRWVGLYGDGRKEVGKKFTIGIAASLTRVERASLAWDYFSRTLVFMADESHMCPAETLEKVCANLLATAPFRFFFSATQTRTDGAELLLKGITGPVVYDKSFKELVDEGFLAKPHWKMVRCPSTHFYHSDDALKMTQQHLFYSPFVLKKASVIINALVRRGQRVLVLVDEMEQFTKLLSLLTVEARFAHGGVTKDNRKKLPEKYWKSDPTELVEAFDRGEFPVLVGTSCVSMGTDILSPETVVYLQGGQSAIQIPQAVGRGTRRGFVYPDTHRKTQFNFIDFCPVITNQHVDDVGDGEERVYSIPFRHALARARLYNQLYPGELQWL